MLSRLRGACLPLALKVSKVIVPICRQSSFSPITSNCYTKRPVSIRTPLPILRLSATNLSCGLHTSPVHRQKRRKNPEDTDLFALMGNYIQELKKAPKGAMPLSLVGLIPLVAVPLTMDFTQCYHPDLAFLQIACANCMLSFFGGVRWGYTIPESSPARMGLFLGAVLPYTAWMSLILWQEIGASALMLIGGLVALMFGGAGMITPFPIWLSFLKTLFCIVAFISVGSTMWMSSVYPEKPSKTES